MKSRLTTYTILAALLWAMILPTTVAKPKAPTRASLEQVLKHAPGDMSTRCQLIELLLQQGDTIAAEGHIALADKLQTNACVQIQKARIAYARGRYAEAAIAYAKAFTLDVIPQNETGAYRTDSLTHGAIDTRLRVAATQDKTNAYAPVGRAELAFYRGDTAAGIGFLRLALQRGDTLQRERIDSLSRTIQRDTTETGTLLYTIPFERKNGVPTLSVTANGLKIKAEIDTTATRCTISGVESHYRNSLSARLSRATYYDNHDDYQRLLAEGNECIRINKSQPNGYYVVALAQLGLKNYPEALRQAELAIAKANAENKGMRASALGVAAQAGAPDCHGPMGQGTRVRTGYGQARQQCIGALQQGLHLCAGTQ